jgi:hypothetical protein
MADVQIQQPTDSGSSTAVVWAIVVIALLAIIAWFLFARGGETTDLDAEINVNPPQQTTPPPATPPPSP